MSDLTYFLFVARAGCSKTSARQCQSAWLSREHGCGRRYIRRGMMATDEGESDINSTILRPGFQRQTLPTVSQRNIHNLNHHGNQQHGSCIQQCGQLRRWIFRAGTRQVLSRRDPNLSGRNLPLFFLHGVQLSPARGAQGYKFWVERSTMDGLSAKRPTCSHPFRSHPGSRLQPIGWVPREGIEEIRQICGRVSRIDRYCCQHWANAAIDALREDQVLHPLQESDNADNTPGIEEGI